MGIGDWAQSPIPNPQSPIPNPQVYSLFNFHITLNKAKIKIKNLTINMILISILCVKKYNYQIHQLS